MIFLIFARYIACW